MDRRSARFVSWNIGPTAFGRGIVSLGYAVLTPEMETPEALVHAADAALYRAKDARRNRVRA